MRPGWSGVMAELLNRLLQVNIVHAEMILYSVMVRDPSKLDHCLPRANEQRQFSSYHECIEFPSLLVQLLYQEQADVMMKPMTFLIDNHYNDEFYSKARAYCARFVKYRIESKVVQGRRSFVKVPDRVFGSASKDRKELHINCLAEFKQFMLNSGWNPERFKEITRELPEGRDVNSNDHQVAVPVRERSFWYHDPNQYIANGNFKED
ncbi:hypothetical protein DDB_G0267346 [Dictyostelium discoideum AX4]|uniref:Uncharacterized protein n=1 Tax=Dictyostelium discoideum TaxID=44689 RepID=Q55GY4_DICDI|nr:hypothetical protein DDB_G0267346 [Dictyostelium discoideum AX4]EAL73779.1 hypothetical protein DDB_G0267346 [Dictyostelium discoideum AX4]|eukprot:XP_647703.1 hypothetical protein DDB_G0267346 [Dictyostelium discoideum AX4]